ncbi:hypothetical protein BpHYR1_003447 [Brachionus plicatilis]|uniref:Uncharacterized protein n=1 Tax=Brachionus plicatilis TaxID=10195 RepID=A0A3M7TC99_BRAPC|nr:hypothetical protein BpHYR1_003447 [Brachionus plicatilis]
MIILFAPIKFNPRPPTFVVSKNINILSFMLNSFTNLDLVTADVVPSIRLYVVNNNHFARALVESAEACFFQIITKIIRGPVRIFEIIIRHQINMIAYFSQMYQCFENIVPRLEDIFALSGFQIANILFLLLATKAAKKHLFIFVW